MSLLSGKYPGESVVVTFDFTAELGTATIAAVESVVVVTAGGIDLAADDILDGDAAPETPLVLQMVTGGVAGVNYKIICIVTASDDRVLADIAVLPVVPL